MPDSLPFPDRIVALQVAELDAYEALAEDTPPSAWSDELRADWDRRWEAYRRAAYYADPEVLALVHERGHFVVGQGLKRAARAVREARGAVAA